MNHTYQYWIRTATGLEEIVLQEIRKKLPITSHEYKHRSVFVSLTETSSTKELLCSLKTADDVYGYLGVCKGIDKSKASVDYIATYFEQEIVPKITSFTTSDYLRVTVSFLGKRNFNRFYVETAINAILQKHTKQTILWNEKGEKWKKGEQKIRIHIEGDEAYFGYSLQDKPLHRRTWRGDSYNGQLHPPIAAAMAQIAQPTVETMIIDPFCGSGTILIESILVGNTSEHFGFDISDKALSIAQTNAANAKINITFHHKDFAANYANFESYYMLSNPPWDAKHSINQRHFFKQLLLIVNHSKGAILLIPQPFIAILSTKKVIFTEILQTRIRGKLASIIKI